MARPLRIEFAAVLYHLTSRGNGQEDIYLDDDDREDWLAVLAGVAGAILTEASITIAINDVS